MSHDAYSALSDPTRRRILAALQAGARPVGELVAELEVSQPTVSKHLKVLRDAGMVTTRAQGQKRFYSIAPEPFVAVVQWLDEVVSAAAPKTRAPAPQESEGPGEGTEAPAPTGATSPGATTPVEDPDPRPVPWFTSEVGEAAEAEVTSGHVTTGTPETPGTGAAEPAGDVVEGARGADAAGAGAQSAEEPVGDVVEDADADADADAGVQNAEGADATAAEGERGTDGEPSEGATGAGEDPEESESADARDTLETDVSAESDVQPGTAHEEEPLDIEPRGVAEAIGATDAAEPMRSRGGAHRRQSGLLSTLTGFRRRSRGSRRD